MEAATPATSAFGSVSPAVDCFPKADRCGFCLCIVGLARAKDRMLSGRVIGVDEALATGLVNSVHAPTSCGRLPKTSIAILPTAQHACQSRRSAVV